MLRWAQTNPTGDCKGALLGAVLTGININTQNLDALGPAIALMLLPLLYGYIVKALIRLVLVSRSRE